MQAVINKVESTASSIQYFLSKLENADNIAKNEIENKIQINFHRLTPVVLSIPNLKRPARSYASLTAGLVCLPSTCLRRRSNHKNTFVSIEPKD